ncbi:tyrosine-type recombinase/integrase [Kribbella qitaiheensis]
MPATINAYLAAIDHFTTNTCGSPGSAPPNVSGSLTGHLRLWMTSSSANSCGLRNGRTRHATSRSPISAQLHRDQRRGSQVLDVEDLAMSARRGKLTVWQGKGTDGGKYREVPLHSAARSGLRIWLDERAELPVAVTTGALFLSRLGARLSDRSIRTIVSELGTAAGLVHTEGPDVGRSKGHPQMLRHTFATQLIRNGVDVVLVADLLGYASLDTTRIYTHASMADLERALEDNLLTDD